MTSTSRKNYLYSLDWVRALTIAAVVMVHSVRFALVPADPLAGRLLQVLVQFGRVSFMIVTGFIIAYQYRERTPRWTSFFKRRAKSSGAPYLLWLILFLALAMPVWPVMPFVGRLSRVLFTGYGHLYYLIITFQMYLLAPVLVWALRKSGRRVMWLGFLGILWEVLSWTMSGYFHLRSWTPALFVSTYVGYFVIGGALGYEWDRYGAWMADHRRYFTYGLAPTAAMATAMFFLNLHWLGAQAAVNEFQPMSAIYCLSITAMLLASGTWFEKMRSERSTLASGVSLVADASFGIYLVHPLFVHGWLHVAQWLGIALNAYVNTAVTLSLGLGLSVAMVAAIRLLPFSEWVIGTARRPAARVVSANATEGTGSKAATAS